MGWVFGVGDLLCYFVLGFSWGLGWVGGILVWVWGFVSWVLAGWVL